MEGAKAAGPEMAEQPGAQKFRTKAIEAVPPNLRDAFERVVLAGEAIMFDKGMQPEIQKELSREAPVFRKLAESIVGLIGLIHREAKGKTPPEVIVPAAIELLHEAAAFVQESGMMEVTPDDLKQATQYLVVLLLKGQGAKDDQIQKVFAGQPAQPAGQQQPPQGGANGLQPA